MTAATGLSERELEMIRSVLACHEEVTGAILFGSRAKATAAPSSDVDISLLGTNNPLVAEEIAAELEELPLPYRFDVNAFEAIRHEPLREHIQRVGVKIY
ncbi:MAG: nucleotidyltransferase domain-containing protein [Candidatus Hydrogenedentes bacterium]|nr:nucleotidyltransferase domain-containing protein [Candidatus Hydrogenedentota bacterium]